MIPVGIEIKRFGCTLKRETGQFVIYVPDIDDEQARATVIDVKPVLTTYAEGALVCLAFEISPNPVLPRYCFYPFDVTAAKDLEYLEQLGESGQVQIVLTTLTGDILREHPLTPAQCKRLREMRSEATNGLQGNSNYSFGAAVERFETAVWLPQLFERALLASIVG